MPELPEVETNEIMATTITKTGNNRIILIKWFLNPI